MMKLVTAVVQEEDCGPVSAALVEAGFHATRVASTGGFLHRGNVTLLIGVEDVHLALLLDILRRECHARTSGAGASEVTVGGAVIFVQEIAQYHRI